jgi:hypothetical protein
MRMATEQMPSAAEIMVLPTREVSLGLLRLMVEGETTLLIRDRATHIVTWPAHEEQLEENDVASSRGSAGVTSTSRAAAGVSPRPCRRRTPAGGCRCRR